MFNIPTGEGAAFANGAASRQPEIDSLRSLLRRVEQEVTWGYQSELHAAVLASLNSDEQARVSERDLGNVGAIG